MTGKTFFLESKGEQERMTLPRWLVLVGLFVVLFAACRFAGNRETVTTLGWMAAAVWAIVGVEAIGIAVIWLRGHRA